jgi:hypothetical protein
VPIDGVLRGDQIETDAAAIAAYLAGTHPDSARVPPDSILAVVSTTSCFAPRAPDDILKLGRLCAAANVAQVVNNAYGVQCPTLMAALDAAARHGRVDAVVQSTDKNFGVPVGGAIIAAFGVGPGAAQVCAGGGGGGGLGSRWSGWGCAVESCDEGCGTHTDSPPPPPPLPPATRGRRARRSRARSFRP